MYAVNSVLVVSNADTLARVKSVAYDRHHTEKVYAEACRFSPAVVRKNVDVVHVSRCRRLIVNGSTLPPPFRLGSFERQYFF